jgi:hypothetical protein
VWASGSFAAGSVARTTARWRRRGTAEDRGPDHRGRRIKGGWLYAQFCVSKTVTLKKSVTSLHLIRDSDIWSDAMTAIAPKAGGLVEFYRSPARKLWTPTGVNVPK